MRNSLYVLAALVLALLVAGTELTFINGKVAALTLAALSTTALFFSMAGVNVNDDGDAVKWKGFGNEVSLPSRLLNNNLLIIGMFSVILFMQYKILDATEKLIAATAEYTYVLSLNQEARERLRIQMPDSLRRRLHEQ